MIGWLGTTLSQVQENQMKCMFALHIIHLLMNFYRYRHAIFAWVTSARLLEVTWRFATLVYIMLYYTTVVELYKGM